MTDEEHDAIVEGIANRLEQYYHTVYGNYMSLKDEYRLGQIRGAEDAYKMVEQMKKSFTLEPPQ